MTDGGLFRKFEWMPDDYGAFLEKAKGEVKERKERQEALHKDKPFRPAPPKQAAKYENPFQEGDTDYLHPFLGEEDPYEAAKDEVLREKWVEETKYLNGDFKPAYMERSL